MNREGDMSIMHLDIISNRNNKNFNKFNYNEKFVMVERILPYRIFSTKFKDKEFGANRYLELVYVVEGMAKVKLKKSTRTLNKGEFCIIVPKKAYGIYSEDEDNVLIVFQICPKYLEENFAIKAEEIGDYIFSKDITNIVNKQRVEYSIGLLYLESLNCQNDVNVYIQRLKNLIYDIKPYLLSEKCIKCSLSKGTVESVVWDILEKYSDINIENISLERLSVEYNVSYSYLSRVFKKVVGMNVTDYFLKQKLNITLDLLINTDKTIGEISKSSGFPNGKTLNRDFKRILNVSPTEFRLRCWDIDKKERRETILKDCSIQKFVKKIERQRDKKIYIKDKNYKLNIDNNLGYIMNIWGKFTNLNFIINNEASDLDQVLSNYSFKKIGIKVEFIEDEFVLVIKDKVTKRPLKLQINKFIRTINKSNIIPIIQLDFISKNRKSFYENEDVFYEIYKYKLKSALDSITTIIGKDRLAKWKFELYVPDINKVDLDSNDLKILYRHINRFVEILMEGSESKDCDWGLYIGELEIKKWKNNMDYIKKLKSLSYNPRVYRLDLLYNHEEMLSKTDNIYLEENVNCLIDKVRDNLMIESEENKSELVITFKYVVNDFKLLNYYNDIYYNLFLKTILLSAKQSKFYIESCQIISGIDGNIDYGVFRNELGIELAPYYVYKFMQQMKPEIIYMEEGCFATKSLDDISIILHTNYDEYYEFVKSSFQINDSKFEIGVSLNIDGLEGKYKVVEYQISYENSIFYKKFIKDIDPELISEEEEKYIKFKTTPNMKIKFLNIKDTLRYSTKLKFLGIILIKLQKISR